jgi:DNA-binding PadR family transcriptional regulator
MMSIPETTHLQFLLMSILSGSEMSGRELRARLGEEGVRKSAPAFYQLMARLEDQKLVEGWYVPKEVEGQRIRERHYKLLGAGALALDRTREFYRARSEPAASLAREGALANVS